jgi:DNA replication and repair protein RecF
MNLSRLQINNVRNLQEMELLCSPQFNLIYGENGSGKTSLLEAIHILALGRSFRSHVKSRLINHAASSLSVFAEIEAEGHRPIPMGIQKFISGSTQTRLKGEDISSIAEIIALLPTQLLNPNSFELINTGSKLKRQFIDWGLFHVKHEFYEIWTKTERILRQRNAALKQHLPRNEISIWDEDLSDLAVSLNTLRADYVNDLLPVISEFMQAFVDFPRIDIRYHPGWDVEHTLSSQLLQTFFQDFQRGYTRLGPQRANLQIESEGQPVHDILSRGQQKLLVCIMRFAQAELLYRQTGKTCLYLIDDLTSELDADRRKQLVQLIKQQSGQFFITSLELKDLEYFQDMPHQMFHVKHGSLLPSHEKA